MSYKKSNGEPSKIRFFQSSESILEVKYELNLSKYDYVLRILNQWNNFYKNIFNFSHFWKTLFSKFVPYFCRFISKSEWQLAKKIDIQGWSVLKGGPSVECAKKTDNLKSTLINSSVVSVSSLQSQGHGFKSRLRKNFTY